MTQALLILFGAAVGMRTLDAFLRTGPDPSRDFPVGLLRFALAACAFITLADPSSGDRLAGGLLVAATPFAIHFSRLVQSRIAGRAPSATDHAVAFASIVGVFGALLAARVALSLVAPQSALFWTCALAALAACAVEARCVPVRRAR